MNNTDIYNFDFVNRFPQREKIKSFLKGEEDYNVAWISGCHGVGKTYFLNYVTENIATSNIISVELSSEDKNPNCLFHLLTKLESTTKKSFVTYFKNNYKDSFELLKNIGFSILENTTHINIKDIVNVLFDRTMVFIENEKKQQSASRVVINYIEQILKDNDLLIVIDNFTLCDSASFSIIVDIILNYSHNDQIESNESKHKVYFILVTTDEKIQCREDITKRLLEKVPLIPIELQAFDSYWFFAEILSNIFELNKSAYDAIERIFDYCKGNPENLKDFLHKVDKKKGIVYSSDSSKAYFDINVVNDTLQENSLNINIETMPLIQQIVLYIVVDFGRILTLNTLNLILKGFYENVFKVNVLNELAVLESLNALKAEGILEFITAPNGNFSIKTEHDLKFESIKAQCERNTLQLQISLYLYDFLTSNTDFLIQEGYHMDDINLLKAYHAWKSSIAGWEKINYELGCSKYANNLFPEAAEIFSRLERLENKLDFLSQANILQIAKCYFDYGDYEKANSVLNEIPDNSIENEYEYHYLKSKIYNVMLKKERALEEINTCINFCEKETLDMVCVLNMKQQIMVDIIHQRNAAKSIYDQIKKLNVANLNTSPVYGKVLKSVVEFYRGSIVCSDLMQAEQIAAENNDDLELAYIYTNRGFDYFWQLKTDAAKQEFLKSYELLKNIKMHEVSYPLNNLAVCYMLSNDFETAATTLNAALLWNQSAYVEITATTMLMVCYAKLKKEKYCRPLIKKLQDLLSKEILNDISFELKVSYNLGYALNVLGENSLSKNYFERSRDIAEKSKPYFLPYTWIENFDQNIEEYIKYRIHPEQETFLNQRFEPYLVTFSHD